MVNQLLRLTFRAIINFLDRHPRINNIVGNLLRGGQLEITKLIQNELKLHKGERLLDICCGSGYFGRSFSQGVFYAGVDLNFNALRIASQKYKGDRHKIFICMDIRKMEFSNKKFDKIIFINALHHFSDEDAMPILKGISETAKDKILIIDAIPNPKNWLKRKLIENDRGQFKRSFEHQFNLIERYLRIDRSAILNLKTVDQTVFLCRSKIQNS